ncbi:MAG TPA: TerC family protein [Cyclobacteriaceae bacterium]|nr:TerC family protein [Cyclobacteriaceae bacterium]
MEIAIWSGFILIIIILLALDLGVFHKKSGEISAKDSMLWTAIWIVISLAFNVGIYFAYESHLFGIGSTLGHPMNGREAALNFFVGYLLEKSLSIDNLFVIAMIFAYFKVPLKYQHEILFWGILGTLISRGVLIIFGAALINNFSWVSYIFGILLIFSAVKMITARQDNVDPYKNPVIKFLKRFYPITKGFHEGKFFVIENGVKAITPLFVVLVVIETTDIMFAVDSIPAIFAVTTDAFIVFTSNVFAILGLRSLYFVLAAFMKRFHYLKMSLVFLLAFIGVKMLLVHFFKFPILVSLAIIAGILGVGVIASIYAGDKDSAQLVSPIDAVKDIEQDQNKQ